MPCRLPRFHETFPVSPPPVVVGFSFCCLKCWMQAWRLDSANLLVLSGHRIHWLGGWRCDPIFRVVDHLSHVDNLPDDSRHSKSTHKVSYATTSRMSLICPRPRNKGEECRKQDPLLDGRTFDAELGEVLAVGHLERRRADSAAASAGLLAHGTPQQGRHEAPEEQVRRRYRWRYVSHGCL